MYKPNETNTFCLSVCLWDLPSTYSILVHPQLASVSVQFDWPIITQLTTGIETYIHTYRLNE